MKTKRQLSHLNRDNIGVKTYLTKEQLAVGIARAIVEIDDVLRRYEKIPNEVVIMNDELLLDYIRTQDGRVMERTGRRLARLKDDFGPGGSMRKAFDTSFEAWANEYLTGGEERASVYIQLHRRVEDARFGTDTLIQLQHKMIGNKSEVGG